ncbi:MAG: hypothetical protein AB2L18_09940 [Anaerolineaceae bacterium]
MMATKKEKTIDVTPFEVEEKTTAPAVEEAVSEKKGKTGTSIKAAKKNVSEEEQPRKNESHLSFLHGPVLLGIGLLLLGIVLLVGELLSFPFGSMMWPFIFIIPGSLLFWSAVTSHDSHAEGLAILGSMMMTLGLIFLLQQLFGMWASWAYAWALLAPTSIGVAQVFYGKQQNRASIVKNGKGLIEVGLTMFFIFFVFFELILNISGKNLIPVGLPAFPVALIVMGIFIILRTVLRKK